MDNCNEHWCEHYGKGSEKCDRCVKKDSTKDKPELQILLRRRVDKIMASVKDNDRSKGMSR